MFNKLSEHLENSSRQLDALNAQLFLFVTDKDNQTKKRIDRETTSYRNKLSSLKQNLEGIKIDHSKDSMVFSFLKNFGKMITSTDATFRTIGKSVPKKESPKKKDETNLFLREDKSDDKIIDLLRKIDKNLNIRTIGSESSSGSSSSNGDSKKEDKSSTASSIEKVAAGAGAMTLGKKILDRIRPPKGLAEKATAKTGEVVAEKAVKPLLTGASKVLGKFAKKAIPIAGVAVSLWDLVDDIKTGYSDYKMFDAKGDEPAKARSIGYTMLGVTSNLLGIVGSLGAATGIGLPVSLALDAVSLGLDLFADSLRNSTIEADAKVPDLNVVNSNPGTNTNGIKLPVKVGNHKEVVHNKKNIPINDSINLKKTSKVMEKLAKTTQKNMIVSKDAPKKTWYQDLCDKLSSMGDGLLKTASNVASDVEAFTGKVSENVKAAINTIQNPVMKKIAIKTAYIESSFRPNAAPNGDAGAVGLYQFIPSTWNKYAKKYGYSLNDRKDPVKSTRVYQDFLTDQRSQLVHNLKTNAIGDDELYMAHFLGVAGATRFIKGLQTNPNSPAINYVDAASVANNRESFFNSVGRPYSLRDVYLMEHNKNLKGENYIGQFSLGSGNISSNGVALVHEGEMIIPSEKASKIRSSINNPTPIDNDDDDPDESFWLNTFMVELANVVKLEYIGAN